jgi:hypothetical protein
VPEQLSGRPPCSTPSLQSLSQLVLGSDARMRRYLSRYLLSAAVYAFSLLAQLAQVWMGHAPPVAGLAYVGVLAVTVTGFYVMIRSSFSHAFCRPVTDGGADVSLRSWHWPSLTPSIPRCAACC